MALSVLRSNNTNKLSPQERLPSIVSLIGVQIIQINLVLKNFKKIVNAGSSFK